MKTIFIILFSISPVFCITDRSGEEPEISMNNGKYTVLPEICMIEEGKEQKSIVFNQYAECEPGRLEWYYDFTEFKRALGVCGFDNVRLRFDRTYRDSNSATIAAYYFTLTDFDVVFDSLSAMLVCPNFYGQPDTFKINIKNKKIVIPQKMLISDLVDRQIQKSQKTQAYAIYAKTIHDSFLSRLVLKGTNEYSHYCFTFRISNNAYSIIGAVRESGNRAEIRKHEERLEMLDGQQTVGAYAIGYQNAFLAHRLASGVRDPFLEERNIYQPITITDYSLKYNGREFAKNSKLKLFEINVTAKSMEGLMQIAIKINGAWNIRRLDGATLATHTMQIPYPEDCNDFEAKVTDIYGESVSERNPRFVRDLDNNGIHAFDSLWKSCDRAEGKRRVDVDYLKRMEHMKKAAKANRAAENIIKMLPLLLLF